MRAGRPPASSRDIGGPIGRPLSGIGMVKDVEMSDISAAEPTEEKAPAKTPAEEAAALLYAGTCVVYASGNVMSSVFLKDAPASLSYSFALDDVWRPLYRPQGNGCAHSQVSRVPRGPVLEPCPP